MLNEIIKINNNIVKNKNEEIKIVRKDTKKKYDNIFVTAKNKIKDNVLNNLKLNKKQKKSFIKELELSNFEIQKLINEKKKSKRQMKTKSENYKSVQENKIENQKKEFTSIHNINNSLIETKKAIKCPVIQQLFASHFKYKEDEESDKNKRQKKFTRNDTHFSTIQLIESVKKESVESSDTSNDSSAWSEPDTFSADSEDGRIN